MQHYKLKNSQQFDGGFTDLFLIGTDRTAARGTDFTTVGLQQTYNLIALNLGDIVMPTVLIDVNTAIAGPTTVTGSVGVTGALTQLTAAGSLLAAGSLYYASPAAAGPYPTIAAAKYLTFDLNTTVANVSAITAGQIAIWCTIVRRADRNPLRFAF